MPLLSKGDYDAAAHLLNDTCAPADLEEILSATDTFLGFQGELGGMKGVARHKRLGQIVAHLFSDRLLEVAKIRDCVFAAKSIRAINRWQPGSPAAVDLCRQLGLSDVFAGFALPTLPDPLVTVYPPRPRAVLQDYQIEVLEKAKSLLTDRLSALVSLPTGSGKTVVATSFVCEWLTSKRSSSTVIWTAHTDELCEQACDALEEAWRSAGAGNKALIVRCWGPYARRLLRNEQFAESIQTLDKTTTCFVVTNPQSLNRLIEGLIPSFMQRILEKASLMVVDEAHRAAAPTYKTFIWSLQKLCPEIRLLGLSATPVRSTYSSEKYRGTEELAALFENLIEPNDSLGSADSPVQALQQRGILAKLSVKALSAKPMAGRAVASAVNKHSKRLGKCLVFSPSVGEALVTKTYLTELGSHAETISGTDSKSRRLYLVDQLKSGALSILCNCELLTIGFDAPAVSQIYLARQTESQVLYKQIVGRGLRGPAFGGSEECTLYLCGVQLSFDSDPNTSDFARSIWLQT
jgi:superfamily II DNA or RNA helicase